MNKLSRKVALVTGASGGIGRAVALALAEAGYDIGVHYFNNRDKAEEVSALVTEQGRQAVTLCANISDRKQVETMIEAVRICLGEIDLLVNCAGIANIGLFTDTTAKDWERMIGINLTGTYNCCRLTAPMMISRGSGCIINISSVWGIYGASCEVSYSAAKSGIIGLTQALAKELGPSGVRVNCIAPGYIETEMNGGFDEETVADIIDRTPAGRTGKPEDVANSVVFLASDKASFITGATLPVTGGFC